MKVCQRLGSKQFYFGLNFSFIWKIRAKYFLLFMVNCFLSENYETIEYKLK